MSKLYFARQGESVGSVAKDNGFPSYKAIYDHPANQELKRRRPDPNLLLPGDPIAIPDAIPRTVTRALDRWHDETVEVEGPILRLKLLDPSGKALPNQDYQLTVSGRERYGATNASGILEEPLEYGIRSAVLSTTVTLGDQPKELVWRLNFDAVDPKGSVEGLQGRLYNLGYYRGPVDGCFGPATRGAVAAFQTSVSLPATGIADENTWAALERQHDKSA
ncbi:MAG: peptidoglycan-binding domain-containing protein [Polyangiaceae bacterium]